MEKDGFSPNEIGVSGCMRLALIVLLLFLGSIQIKAIASLGDSDNYVAKLKKESHKRFPAELHLKYESAPMLSMVYDLIWSLPEVQQLGNQYDECKKCSDPLNAWINEMPKDNYFGCYWVKVGAFHWGMWQTTYHFFVSPGCDKVYHFDTIDGEILELDAWRYSRAKKEKKYEL
jgi:hypothetical protein